MGVRKAVVAVAAVAVSARGFEMRFLTVNNSRPPLRRVNDVLASLVQAAKGDQRSQESRDSIVACGDSRGREPLENWLLDHQEAGHGQALNNQYYVAYDGMK